MTRRADVHVQLRSDADADTGALPTTGCDGCELGRRAFVVGAAQAAAALLGLAAMPSLARAVALRDAGAARDERRYAIPTGDGVSVDEDASVILARVGSAVYGFSLACPHKRTALAWQPRNNRFECPKHKSKYQPDGTFISGRATRSMDRFAIRRDGAHVVLDLGRLYREDREAAAWRAAVVRVDG
jgi:nitrite reductase/ring-hydroxylating ferredoxin subunit